MPPSMQIDASSITTWEDLSGNVRRSRITFARDNPGADPYLQFTSGDSSAALRLTNVATPTASSDAVNKSYVDSVIQGLTIKAPVRAVATANGSLATAFAPGQVIDGVTLEAGNRILLMGQTNKKENGIYVVPADGSTPATRAADFPASTVAAPFGGSGVYVFVDEGTVYADRSFVCIANRGSDLVGEHEIDFVQFGARPSAYEGAGLILSSTKSGALDVNPLVVPYLGNNQTFTGTNTFQGAVTIGSTHTLTAPKVTGLVTADILANTDAVNLEYVSTRLTNTVNGQQGKVPARVATTAEVTLANVRAGDAVDGVTLAANDRLLLLYQTAGVENGLYAVSASAAPTRVSDLAAGASAMGTLLAVSEGTVNGNRLFLCTNDAGTDVVGTHALVFAPVAHTLPALAGTSLTGNTTDLRLDVRTDNTTIETDATVGNNFLRLKDLGITNAKIADSTIANGKLVNPQVRVKVQRGLLRTTATNQTPAVDTSNVADLGLSLALGADVGIQPDFSVVPDLAATNTFANANTFQGVVTVSNSTAATSTSTGALVVTGGLGVGGSVYCTSTYNMSDQRLKRKLRRLEDARAVDAGTADALDDVAALEAYEFEWNEQMPGLAGQRSYGLMAQQVQGVAPLAVHESVETSFLAVDYTKLVPHLVAAVKVLKRKVDELEGRLAPAPSPTAAEPAAADPVPDPATEAVAPAP